MNPARPLIPRLVVFLAVLAAALAPTSSAQAQAIDPEGRVVREVRFTGLVSVRQALADNAVNTAAGQPYNGETIRQDIVRLTELGKFGTVEVKVEPNPADNSVNVIFVVTELPTLLAVKFANADRFDEKELQTLVGLQVGDAIDPALVDLGAEAIEKAYAEKGYFAASVKHDEAALKDKRELLYRVTEGPRVRVLELRFEGNSAFNNDTLDSRISSSAYSWPFISGFMDRTKLDQDVAALRQYYQDRGYLDAQVGRRIELSPRQDRAVVTFEITEGPQHTVRDVRVRFFQDLQQRVRTEDQLMSEAQIRMVINLVRGSIYSDERLEESQEAVEYWYGEIGFINTRVRINRNRVFDRGQPVVDVVVDIEEGAGPTLVGDVSLIGLTRTQQKVLLRRVRGLEPGRPVNLRGLETTRELVKESIWFRDGKITALGDPDTMYRDFLIEARERNTGSISLGAGLSSDAGIFGAFQLQQRNFDIADWPESFDEFMAQRAFLGAGQTFNLTIAPGNENSNYAIGFREPYLFETDYFFDAGVSLFTSVREDFDEGRFSFNTGLGRRLGDVWTGSVRVRAETVEISDIDPSAPVDVFAVSGNNGLTSLGLSLIRSTTDSNIQPSRGSRITLSATQYGALGGDFDFTRLGMGYDQFWTLDEDFLGRKTILSLQIDAGYIPQDNADVPLFERFYAGGRSFRGFGFRGIGPRGVRNDTLVLGDDPVGGKFEFISRLQYEVPLYDELIRWALFTDQGTIQDTFGFGQWRVAVGAGVRLKLPVFGQAPIAIDFGFPLIDEEGDETQVLSFSVAVPFN